MNEDEFPLPVNPQQLGAPSGFSHGMLCPPGGRFLFVAGQIGWDSSQQIVGPEFLQQFEQALENVVSVVAEAGGKPQHIARLTIYVADRREYLEDVSAVGAAYRRLMDRHYPAMSLVEVQGLLEPGAKVELEATAILPAVEDSAG